MPSDHRDPNFDPFAAEMPPDVLYKANDHVAVITFNRPADNNAINDGLSFGLRLAVERIKKTPSMRVVFLTGAGNMFSAGGDPKAFQAVRARCAARSLRSRLPSHHGPRGAQVHDAAAESGGSDDGGNDASAMDFAHLLRDMQTLPCFVACLCNGETTRRCECPMRRAAHAALARQARRWAAASDSSACATRCTPSERASSRSRRSSSA